MMRRVFIAHESWPLAGNFAISRGSKTTAEVVTITLEEDGHTGRGECVPYAHYGETVAGVMEALEHARLEIETGLKRENIPAVVSPKAARNALDCAMWDLEAKQTGTPAWKLAGLSRFEPVVTVFTLGIDDPDVMAAGAADAANQGRNLLKLKLGQDNDAERLRAIRQAAPNSRLIVDANEGWSPAQLPEILQVCSQVGVELVEQPLPASDDEYLRSIEHPISICADESAHDLSSLPSLIGKYDAINIKLDKTGGLTGALALADAVHAAGLDIMAGCMLATSLAMAPAMIFAQQAKFVDLDGPLLLAQDRQPGITFNASTMLPPPPSLWG